MALEQHGFGALCALVKELYSDGLDEGEVLGILERSRERLVSQDRETDEDRILEVMDFVVGFCSPQNRLQRDSVGSGDKDHH